MFAGQIKTLDRTIYWMQKIETAGEISSWLVGGSLLFNASKQGRKVLLKTVAKAAASGAASIAIVEAVASGLRTASVEEERIEHLQTAAELVSRLLLWKNIHTGNKLALAKTASPSSPLKYSCVSAGIRIGG